MCVVSGAPTPPPPSPAGARRLRLIGPLIAVLVALVAALLISRAGSGDSQGTAHDPATPVTVSVDPTRWELPRLDGPGLVRLGDFKGKPLVGNFFAPWCTPRPAQLPALSA